MGSFQQVTLGLICLAAAFAFGNYVNNNPPASNPMVDSIAESNAGTPHLNSGLDEGNIQSRLSVAELDRIGRRPAPIATMRNPLKPRFKLPVGTQSATPIAAAPASPTGNAQVDDVLPPPSQLNNQRSLAANSIKSNVLNRSIGMRETRSRQVPDFSQIAAEFKNTPIELPKLGSMPAIKKPTAPEFVVSPTQSMKVQNPNGLKDLAKEFSNAYGHGEIVASPPVPDEWWNKNNLASNVDSDPGYTAKPTLEKNSQTQINDAVFDQEDEVDYLSLTKEPERDVTSSVPRVAGPTDYQSPPANWNTPPSQSEPNPGMQAIMPNANSDKNLNSNRVNSRIQIGGIDYDMPPPKPTEYSQGSNPKRNAIRSVLHEQVAENVMPQPQNSWAKRGNSLSTTEKRSKSNMDQPNRVRTMLPFKLTPQGQTDLVRLSSSARTKINLDTTQFRGHRVRTGDTLQSLSIKYFGRPEYYLDIYLANRNQMRNPTDLREGMNIRIPIYD